MCTCFVLVVGGSSKFQSTGSHPFARKMYFRTRNKLNYPGQHHAQMSHVFWHLIEAAGLPEAEAVLTFQTGEPMAVSLDSFLQLSLASHHGRCCILNLQLLHLPTDYRRGKSAKAFAAFGIVLCSQCLPIDGEAKTDEPFI